MSDKFKKNFKDFSKNSISVLDLNVRSMNKNFEVLSEFYSKMNHIFRAICFSETWANEENINKNSAFQLKNHNVIHQVRNPCKGGGLCIFINETLFCKLGKDLSINAYYLFMIFNGICRTPTRDIKVVEQFCKDIFLNNQNMKHMIFVGYFDMNVLDYEYNRKDKSFFDLMYQSNLIPTRAAKNSATAIDHMITGNVLICVLKTPI